MRQLRHDSGNYRHLQLVQFVRHAIVRHRVHRRIAEYHLAIVGRGRVVVKHRLHVRVQHPLDFRQRVYELQGQSSSLLIHLLLGLHALTVLAELQSVRYLLRQQLLQLLHVHTNVVRAYRLVRLSLVKIVWEDNVLHQRHYLLYLFH